ncbi:hypothetical protein L2E82_08941 [Cichorium intybus]|uniref:Uncharacterized protein n=1 Tax=Cichorium intybus TaxID=13427 RepID=A0ACB9G762_CICIN|nr:hypothetical protein L2E82_08941 [Cichorium intybus]
MLLRRPKLDEINGFNIDLFVGFFFYVALPPRVSGNHLHRSTTLFLFLHKNIQPWCSITSKRSQGYQPGKILST